MSGVEALMRRPVTLLRRAQDGPADDYGTPTWTEEEQATVCELQQAGASEGQGGALQDVSYRVWLPADAAARGWDAVRLEDGTVLELVGDASIWTSPRSGEISHVEADLRLVE